MFNEDPGLGLFKLITAGVDLTAEVDTPSIPNMLACTEVEKKKPAS